MNVTKIIKIKEGYGIRISKELLNEFKWNLGDEIVIEKLTYSKCDTKKIILKQVLVIKNEKGITK